MRKRGSPRVCRGVGSPTSLARFDVAHFRFCREGRSQKISPGNRSVGSRHRRGVTRRPRGARRGSPDPADLPDRQVSCAHRRPRFQRCSYLLSLRQTKETYRSSIWAGSGDARPARRVTRRPRGAGRGETRAQRGFVLTAVVQLSNRGHAKRKVLVRPGYLDIADQHLVLGLLAPPHGLGGVRVG
jgi:hypothetical protein